MGGTDTQRHGSKAFGDGVVSPDATLAMLVHMRRAMGHTLTTAMSTANSKDIIVRSPWAEEAMGTIACAVFVYVFLV